MKITHLFIDLDGTLLASKPVTLQIVFLKHMLAFLKKEHRLNALESMKLIHHLRIALEKKGTEETGNHIRAARVFSKHFGISEEEALKRVHAMVVSVFSNLGPLFFPISGALDFIEWASSRYHLTLATNPVWPRAVVATRLGWAGIREDYFQAITNSETMHFCKPELGYYRELLQQTKIPETAVLMIGDSAKKDLPALEVGIPVFLLKGQGFKLRAPGHMTGDFQALRQYLESLHE